jgi:ABC-type lipopolysaccharide export system ATPase subunit
VNNVSFTVSQGEIVGLLGPNGAGKTTSFYQVVGLIKPDSGEVFLNDINITKLPMYKRAQMGIGYLPQEASVFQETECGRQYYGCIGNDKTEVKPPKRKTGIPVKRIQVTACKKKQWRYFQWWRKTQYRNCPGPCRRS